MMFNTKIKRRNRPLTINQKTTPKKARNAKNISGPILPCKNTILEKTMGMNKRPFKFFNLSFLDFKAPLMLALLTLFWGACSVDQQTENNKEKTENDISTFLQKQQQKVWVHSTTETEIYVAFYLPSENQKYFLSYQFDFKGADENFCNTYKEGTYVLVGIIAYAEIKIIENTPQQFTFSRIEQGEDFAEILSFSEDNQGNLIEKHFEAGQLINQRVFLSTNKTTEAINIECES